MGLVKLEMNKVWVDTAGAKNRAMLLIKDLLGECAEQLADIISREIAHNGNGSSIMRQDAISLVKTIIRESNYDRVVYESGITEESFSSVANDFRVRVLVVLTGNRHGGRLQSKPGRSTFKKNVTGPSASSASSVYDLPDGFNMGTDITTNALNNALKQIEAVFLDVQKRIIAELSDISFWDQFIHVG